ncbi:MAG: ABC transporter ATP-binding protein, partial [Methanosarcinaceae archaeon]|nr:ABC transporter ATP-binding protein [Methanosarcinaceae archaeon]
IQYRLEFTVDDISTYGLAEIMQANGVFVVMTDDIDLVNDTTRWVASRGGDIVEMRTIVPSLEDIFLSIMGVELFAD